MSEDQVPIAGATTPAAKAARRGPPRRVKALPGLPEPLPTSIALSPVDEAAADVAGMAAPAEVAAAPVETADDAPAEVPVEEADPAPDFTPPAAVPAVLEPEEETMATTADTMQDTANKGADMAHDAVNTATDHMKNAANQAQDAAATAADRGRALFADWNSRTKEAMDRSAKAFEQMGDFYKGNLDAIVESSRIAAKGFEHMGQHAAEVTRKGFEDATNNAKTLSQSKSPTEFLKLQGDYARSAFDTMVAETSRSTEAMLKLAGEVAQPVANRMAVAADRMKTVA